MRAVEAFAAVVMILVGLVFTFKSNEVGAFYDRSDKLFFKWDNPYRDPEALVGCLPVVGLLRIVFGAFILYGFLRG